MITEQNDRSQTKSQLEQVQAELLLVPDRLGQVVRENDELRASPDQPTAESVAAEAAAKAEAQARLGEEISRYAESEQGSGM